MGRDETRDAPEQPTPPAAVTSALVLVVLGGLCVVALIDGRDALQVALPGGLPVGNALAAIVLSAWPIAAWLTMRRHSAGRRVAGLSALLSCAWLPLSVALAGNLQLDFHGETGAAWLLYTMTAAFAALASLAWAVLQGMCRRRR